MKLIHHIHSGCSKSVCLVLQTLVSLYMYCGLNYVSLQICRLKSYPPVAQNVTLFGNRVVTNRIGQDAVILEKGGLLIQYDCCLYKKEIWTDKWECHVKVKTEMRGVILQVKECLRFPGHYQELGKRHGADSLSQPSDGTHPTETMILDFQPPEPWDNTLLPCKPLFLQHVVTVALAN